MSASSFSVSQRPLGQFQETRKSAPGVRGSVEEVCDEQHGVRDDREITAGH